MTQEYGRLEFLSVEKIWTRLKQLNMNTHTHTHTHTRVCVCERERAKKYEKMFLGHMHEIQNIWP